MAWEVMRSPKLRSYDTSSLKYVGGGGAAMAPEHARRIGEHLGDGVPGTGYGMTETNAHRAPPSPERRCWRVLEPVAAR